MSQNKLAELSGLSNTYISRIERAKKQISLDALMRVSEALQVPVNDLVYRAGTVPGAVCDNTIAALLNGCTDNEKHLKLFLLCKPESTYCNTPQLLHR